MSLIGVSRHSALPDLRRRVGAVSRPFVVRATALAVGCVHIGFAVALLVKAGLGLPPYDVLASGVSAHTGITLGQAGWIVAAVLLVVATALRRPPSAWGVAYVFGNGVAIDATAHVVNAPTNTPGRLAFLVAAIVVMAAGINLVLFSGTTGGPFELLMQAGEDRGVRRITTRYVLDGAVLVGGILLGGAFGVGTVIYAGLMGLALEVISRIFADYASGRALRVATGSAEGDGHTSTRRRRRHLSRSR